MGHFIQKTAETIPIVVSNRIRLIRTATCIALLVGALLSPRLAHSQTYTYTDIRTFSYAVNVPNVTLNAGQSVDVIVEVGKGNATVDHVIGFQLVFELSSNAAKLSSLSPDMQFSWVKQAGIPVSETQGGVGGEIYQYGYQRTVKIDGAGEILRLRLEAGQNGVYAPDLLLAMGGLLITDELSLRLVSPEIKADVKHGQNEFSPVLMRDFELRLYDLSPEIMSEFELWPNPSSGLCNVQSHGKAISALKVMSLQGQVLSTFGEVKAFDIGQLPAGMYLIQAKNEENEVFWRSVQKF